MSGEPLEKYDQHGYYHSYWPKGHSGVRCDLKFYQACDFWRHYKDHNTEHEGQSLVRLCVSAGRQFQCEEDKTLLDNARKSLNSDPNVLLVDPQFDDNNCPIDYWGEGSCIDFIVEEKLGAYIYKRMIFASLKDKFLLYEHFQYPCMVVGRGC